MGCSSTDARDGGFATAAAMTVSMGLAMVASGLSVLAVAELKRARAELDKTQAEYALDGAQQSAVVAMVQNGAAGRLSWSVKTDLGLARVLAEPEYAKVSFVVAATLPDTVLARLGVHDVSDLRGRLTGMPPAAGDQGWLAQLDAAPLWTACAPSMISRYGQSDAFTFAASGPPSSQGFSWRPGEVWRVKVALASGWTDDRIVRFTGDNLSPTATIERRFSRTEGEDAQCDAVLAQDS